MNLTLINLVLRVRPMTEPALAATLLVLRLCAALWRCFCGSAGRGISAGRRGDGVHPHAVGVGDASPSALNLNGGCGYTRVAVVAR